MPRQKKKFDDFGFPVGDMDGDVDMSQTGTDYASDKAMISMQKRAEELQRLASELSLQKEERVRALKKAQKEMDQRMVTVDGASDLEIDMDDDLPEVDFGQDAVGSARDTQPECDIDPEAGSMPKSGGRGGGRGGRTPGRIGKSPKTKVVGSRGQNWTENEKTTMYLAGREFRFDILEYGTMSKERRETRKLHAYTEMALAIGVANGTFRSADQVKSKLAYHKLDVKKMGERAKFKSLALSVRLGYEFFSWPFTMKFPGYVDDLIDEACREMNFPTQGETYKMLMVCRQKEKDEINRYRQEKQAAGALKQKAKPPASQQDEDDESTDDESCLPTKQSRLVQTTAAMADMERKERRANAKESLIYVNAGTSTPASRMKTSSALSISEELLKVFPKPVWETTAKKSLSFRPQKEPKLEDNMEDIVIVEDDCPELQQDIAAAKKASLADAQRHARDLKEREQIALQTAVEESLVTEADRSHHNSLNSSGEIHYEEHRDPMSKGKAGGKLQAKNASSTNVAVAAIKRLQEIFLVRMDSVEKKIDSLHTSVNMRLTQVNERVAKVESNLSQFQQKVSRTTVNIHLLSDPTGRMTQVVSKKTDDGEKNGVTAHFSGIGADHEVTSDDNRDDHTHKSDNITHDDVTHDNISAEAIQPKDPEPISVQMYQRDEEGGFMKVDISDDDSQLSTVSVTRRSNRARKPKALPDV